MSGFIQDIGNLFGGSATKTDRKNQLAGFGDLSNIFNFGFNTGKSGVAEGSQTERGALSELAAPADYYSKLLSGNRAATLSAVAPTVNAAGAQTDAQKRQLATLGTARGGGVNATSQQLDTNRMKSIDDAINQAKGGAAAGATRVAGETARVGETQLSTALNLLGLGEKAASTSTELAGDSRATSDALHRQASSDATKFGADVLDVLFGA